jgi:hypothetical protein
MHRVAIMSLPGSPSIRVDRYAIWQTANLDFRRKIAAEVEDACGGVPMCEAAVSIDNRSI